MVNVVIGMMGAKESGGCVGGVVSDGAAPKGVCVSVLEGGWNAHEEGGRELVVLEFGEGVAIRVTSGGAKGGAFPEEVRGGVFGLVAVRASWVVDDALVVEVGSSLVRTREDGHDDAAIICGECVKGCVEGGVVDFEKTVVCVARVAKAAGARVFGKGGDGGFEVLERYGENVDGYVAGGVDDGVVVETASDVVYGGEEKTDGSIAPFVCGPEASEGM